VTIHIIPLKRACGKQRKQAMFYAAVALVKSIQANPAGVKTEMVIRLVVFPMLGMMKK